MGAYFPILALFCLKFVVSLSEVCVGNDLVMTNAWLLGVLQILLLAARWLCHLQTEHGNLGEIVKVDHHKKNFVTPDNHSVDVNFNNSSFRICGHCRGRFRSPRDYADRHLSSPLRCE